MPQFISDLLHQIARPLTFSIDSQGRLIITPIEQVRATLMETFGMWSERKDVPTDGVKYMNAVRKGRRLERVRKHETDRH